MQNDFLPDPGSARKRPAVIHSSAQRGSTFSGWYSLSICIGILGRRLMPRGTTSDGTGGPRSIHAGLVFHFVLLELADALANDFGRQFGNDLPGDLAQEVRGQAL